MPSMNMVETKSDKADPKALRILAKSVFRDLQSSGASSNQIVEFASELLTLVTDDLSADSKPSLND